MFLLFAGRDVLVAEGDGGREREKEVWDNDTNEGVMFISLPPHHLASYLRV